MLCFGAVLVFCSLPLFCQVTAQQFSDRPLPVDYPGISDECFNALNTPVACPRLLIDISIDNPRSNDDQLSALCTPECRSSLANVRSGVAQNCTSTNDTILVYKGKVPATYMVDSFLYTYDLSCRKDRASGKFCDSLSAAWANTTWTGEQFCSDCMLGMQQTQLNSSFGYNEDYTSDFESLTSSCNASGYSWTTPAPLSYTPTAAATANQTAVPRVCSGQYHVVPGDDCFTVSQSQKVATFALLDINVLDGFCRDPLPVNATLCLPPTCQIYKLKDDDSCESILRANSNISFAQLRSFNPNINSDCSNLRRFKKFEICLSSPSGNIDGLTIGNNSTGSTATTAVPKPTNAPDQSNINCGKWYTVQDGDNCASISVNLGISLKDFYFMNPEINGNCTNLLLGLAYCVSAVGDIKTYSSYSDDAAFTLPPQTTQVPSSVSSTVTSSITPSISPIAMLPRAPDTISDCLIYANARDPDDPVSTNSSSNQCLYVAIDYKVTVSNLTTWNPSLDAKECALQPGYSYCVRQTNETYEAPSGATSNVPFCGEARGDIVKGTSESCTCFFNVYDYDRDYETCEDIADYGEVGLSDILSWNSWLESSDCDSSLFANFTDNNARPICIGVSESSTGAASSLRNVTGVSPPLGDGATSTFME